MKKWGIAATTSAAMLASSLVGFSTAASAEAASRAMAGTAAMREPTAISTTEGIDASSFALNLAAAVAAQNATAFHTTSSVLSGASSAITAPEASRDASQFSSSLTSGAGSAFNAQSAVLAAESKSLTPVKLSVTSSSVAVSNASASATTIVVRLDISRKLSTGIVWEEIVPYVSTINAAGSVSGLTVEDDAWQADQGTTQQPSGPQSSQTATSAELNGTASRGGSTPASASSSTSGNSSNRAAVVRPDLSSSGRAAVVAYANKYWSSYNSAYIASPDDCTDFSSQALYAGGWTMVDGWYSDDGSWWYDGDPILPKSYAWATVGDFRDFAVNQSKRSKVLSYVDDLVPGEILQYGLNNGGAHSMIVTGTSGGAPLLTYHTNNVHNKPFSVVQADVAAHSPTWYALSS